MGNSLHKSHPWILVPLLCLLSWQQVSSLYLEKLNGALYDHGFVKNKSTIPWESFCVPCRSRSSAVSIRVSLPVSYGFLSFLWQHSKRLLMWLIHRYFVQVWRIVVLFTPVVNNCCKTVHAVLTLELCLMLVDVHSHCQMYTQLLVLQAGLWTPAIWYHCIH